MIAFKRITAKVKYLAFYKCDLCGKIESGGTVRTDFDVSGSAELLHQLNNKRADPANMPVGWSSHSDGRFKCPTCGDLTS